MGTHVRNPSPSEERKLHKNTPATDGDIKLPISLADVHQGVVEKDSSTESTSKQDPNLNPGLQKSVMASIAVCTFYIIVSSSMVFVNKALSYTYSFRMTNSLLLLQMIFSVFLITLAKAVYPKVFGFQPLPTSQIVQLFPISFFYCTNTAAALLALRELSIPSYTLIKRLSPLFTLLLERLLLKKVPRMNILGSVLLMVSGTLFAYSGDIRGSNLGWVLGLGSCLLQATYLSYVKKSGAELGLNSFGVLYYHSILSSPLLVLLILLSGEIPQLRDFFVTQAWMSTGFILTFILSLVVGFLLNYALFLCTEITSPTSTTISGHVKAMAQTVIGMFVLGGADWNFMYAFGTLTNITGGAAYAYFKYRAMHDHPNL